MKNIVLLGLVIVLSNCATPRSREAANVHEVSASEVSHCRALGEVFGTSSYGGVFNRDTGLTYAKNEAINKAGRMNASHLVWEVTEYTVVGARAIGMAYKCTSLSMN